MSFLVNNKQFADALTNAWEASSVPSSIHTLDAIMLHHSPTGLNIYGASGWLAVRANVDSVAGDDQEVTITRDEALELARTTRALKTSGKGVDLTASLDSGRLTVRHDEDEVASLPSISTDTQSTYGLNYGALFDQVDALLAVDWDSPMPRPVLLHLNVLSRFNKLKASEWWDFAGQTGATGNPYLVFRSGQHLTGACTVGDREANSEKVRASLFPRESD